MFLSKILTPSCTIKDYIVITFLPLLFAIFSTSRISERNVNDCFRINEKQILKMTRKGKTVKCQNYTRKMKSPFIIYAAFETILAQENNGKQNPGEY